MEHLVNTILVLLVLMSFLLLSSSRLATCIRAVAIQGALLGILAIAMQDGQLSVAGVLLPLVAAVVKGLLLPWLLFRAMRETETRREVEPLISYNFSIMAGAIAFAVALWLGERLKLPTHPPSSLLVPVAFFSSLAGLLVIVSRRKALTQVLGYLALENGVYAFGAAVALQLPIVVELGILLDVFVGVFVMGIAIFHISREFDHIDTDKLVTLTDRL
ncbi:MAG: hydrogenase [Candidatus Binataceae bacterium]|jgi:hydrogenase-4 component E